MTQPQGAPYGSWKSPISADLISTEGRRIIETVADGEDIYWIEMRPSREWSVCHRSTDSGRANDRCDTSLLSAHEHASMSTVGRHSLVSEGVVYFSNFADQRLYRQTSGSDPQPITPEGDLRYADGVLDSKRNRLICVREDHTDTAHEAVNALVSIGLDWNR